MLTVIKKNSINTNHKRINKLRTKQWLSIIIKNMAKTIISLHKTNLKQKICHVALKVIKAFIMVVKCHVSKAF